MPINPDFVSIVEAEDFTPGIPTSNGKFFFVENKELKVASMTEIYGLVSGSQSLGTITPSSTISAEGNVWGFAGEGTYPNADNLTVAENTLGILTRVDDVWSKVEVVLQNAVDNVTANGITAVNSKAVIDYAQPLDFYPYKSKPISENQQNAASAVNELYIKNYDPLYNYYLAAIQRDLDLTAYGYDPHLYTVKIIKEEKANPANRINLMYSAFGIDEDKTIYESNDKDFYISLDWSKMFMSLDADPAPELLLSEKVSDIDNAPQIKWWLDVKRKGLQNLYLFGAGKNATGGEFNYGLGWECMESMVSGGYNLAIGPRAMKNHQTGAGNIAIGMDAMLNSLECIDVTAVGWEASRDVVAGVGDTSLGRLALANATRAGGNTGLGDSALFKVNYEPTADYGYGNVAVGYTVAHEGITWHKSVILGLAGARNCAGGPGNVLIGSEVMFNRTQTSEYNVCVGALSMLSATGHRNVVLGAYAFNDSQSNENVIIGYNAGNSISTGARNICIGTSAQSGATNVSDSIVIGNNAKATKSNQVVIGTETQTEFVICGVTFTAAQLLALKNLVS